MEAKTGEGKRSLKDGRVEEEEEVEEEDEEEIEGSDNQFGWGEDGRKKMRDPHSKRGSSSSSSSSSSMAPPSCQVEGCCSDMSEAKHYHRRHKVCEFHAKAPSVLIAGLHQRFCQQCSKFHELSEFDDTKRSCRRRLAGHNERRRKNSSNYQGEALY